MSHGRFAQILGEIESRCAKYKRHSLAAAQQWADQNWSLSDSPLSDVVTTGVRYCDVHGLRVSIGLQLKELGAKVCRLLDCHLTDELALQLGDSIYGLCEFAHGVRNEINLDAANNGRNVNDDERSNG